MGYIVPAFPPQIPFLRIDGWLDTPTSHSAFGDRMRARIDAHEGPIFGVFIERERERAVAAFGADGLMLASTRLRHNSFQCRRTAVVVRPATQGILLHE